MDEGDISKVSVDINDDQNGYNRCDDELDANPNIVNPTEIKEVRMAAEKNAILYNMNHKKRGMAIIFNHKKFEMRELSERKGTETDCSSLKTVLKNKFGFEVSVCSDYTADKIHKVINDIASMDHTNHDCIVISILSHGKEGILYAKDTYYEARLIWDAFTADKCPTLAGKPKIFFIQACQGESVDAGVIARRTQTDGGEPSYKIPNQADFLIAFSTVPGYLSWRNEVKGSWFIQALVKELHKSGMKRDLVTLLTFVNQRVAFDFESYKPKDLTLHMKRQVPSFTCRFTRLCVFWDKINN